MMDRQALKSALARTPECLSIEALGALSPDEARGHHHISECVRCQTELALLREFESSDPLPDEGAAVAWISSHLERNLDAIKHPSGNAQRKALRADSRPAISWWDRLFKQPSIRVWIPVGAVAAIALAALLFLRSSREPELQANLGHDTTVYRSQELQTIAPAGELREAPKTLTWKAVSGAATYRVAITEVDHTEVWRGESSDTLMTMPAPVLAKMKAGKPFLWTVSALDPQGVVLASSQAQRFVVIPEKSRED